MLLLSSVYHMLSLPLVQSTTCSVYHRFSLPPVQSTTDSFYQSPSLPVQSTRGDQSSRNRCHRSCLCLPATSCLSGLGLFFQFRGCVRSPVVPSNCGRHVGCVGGVAGHPGEEAGPGQQLGQAVHV